MAIGRSTCSVFGCVLVIVALCVLSASSQYGAQCDNDTSCSGPNQTCSNSSTCTCSPNYVLNDDVVCVKKIAYGEACPSGNFDPCNETGTVCTLDVKEINRCICDDGLYRNAQASCSSVQDLGVSNVFATPTTNKVTLTWKADRHVLNVSYSVTSDQGEGQLEGPVTDTGAVWSNLTSGRKYSFKITTTVPADSIYRTKTVDVKKGDVWTEPDKPGPVVSVILVLPGSPGQQWLYNASFQPSPGRVASYSLVINDEQATGTDTTYTFRTLYPGQNCSYVINAYNKIQNPSEASVGTFRLNTTCPGDVRNLTATQDDDHALVLTFLCPDPRDVPGNIQGYRIQKSSLNSDGLPETNTSYAFPASRISCTNSFNDGVLGEVQVEKSYKFSVRAWNDDCVGDYSQEITFYVAPRVPKLSKTYDGSNLLEKVDNRGLKNTEFEVRICSSCLLDDSRGPVLGLGLVVCTQEDDSRCSVAGVKQLSQIASWANASQNYFAVPYLTTRSDWLTSVRAQPSGLTFPVGHDQTCASFPSLSYCNGPLPMEKQITLVVVQCNVAGCGQMLYHGIFNTRESKPPDSNNMGLILGLAIGLGCPILIGVIILLVVCLKPKRTPSLYNKPGSPYNEDLHGYDQFAGNKANPPPPHRTLTRGANAGYIDPIPGKKFDDHSNEYENPDEVIYDYITLDGIKM